MKRSILNALKESPNLRWICNDCIENGKSAEASDISSLIKKEVKEAIDPVLAVVSSIEKYLPSLLRKQNENIREPLRDPVASPSNDALFPPLKPTRRKLDANAAGNRTPSNLSRLYRDKLVYGTATSATALKGVSPIRKTNNGPTENVNANTKTIFVSRLSPETTVDDILKFLVESKVISNPTEVKCFRLVPKDKDVSELSFVSFKLTVPTELYDTVMNSNLWPGRVALREFIENPPRQRNIATLQLRNDTSAIAAQQTVPSITAQSSTTLATLEIQQQVPAGSSAPSKRGLNEVYDSDIPNDLKKQKCVVQLERQHVSKNSDEMPVAAALNVLRAQQVITHIDLSDESESSTNEKN